MSSKRKIWDYINIPRWICNHLVGKNHSKGHRVAAGLIVMYVGTLIGDIGASMIVMKHVFQEGGGFIHAAGAVPLLEAMEEI